MRWLRIVSGGLVVVGGVQAFCECSVGEVGEDRERDVEVDGERDLGAERVEVKRADLLGEVVLDAPALSVAFDQLFDGRLLLVGKDQGGRFAAESVHGDLAEAVAFDRHGVFVVGDVLVLAGALQTGLGPRVFVERVERGGQLRGALAQRDEPDAELIELGEMLVGGELLVEHQQLGQLAVRLLIETDELDHLT